MLKLFLRSLMLAFIFIPIVVIFILIIHVVRYHDPKIETVLSPNADGIILPGPINTNLSSVAYPAPPPIKRLACNALKKGAITIWFDDIWHSQYASGTVQLMDKAGFVGALSVPTGFVGDPAFMNWDQLRELQAKGWETVSHTVSHFCAPRKYDTKTAAYELTHAKAQLESQGLHTENFVMPCGYNTGIVPHVVSVAKRLYLSYRAAGEKINPLPVRDPYNLTSFSVMDTTREEDIRNWVNAAIKQKGWLILVFHQVDNRKLRYDVSIDQFTNLLTIVKNSGLPVVLPSQVLQPCFP
jgi:hypothetical protein